MEELNFEQTMIMLSLSNDDELIKFEKELKLSKKNQEEFIEELMMNVIMTDVVLSRINEIKQKRNI